MKTTQLPYLAFAVALTLLFVVSQGSHTDADGATLLPLFTLLAACEFAFFITVAGAWVGFREMLKTGFKPLYALLSIACALFAPVFAWWGISLWP